MADRHPALAGFDRAADVYERGRPGYPEAAVGRVVERFRLGPGSTVVDLAAGTGKLTRALRPCGARLVAVEPTPGMRRVFRRTVPDVDLVAARAEALPLGRGTASAVVVAQAFHWFDGPRALAEIARVLAPGGGLALLWNVRDASVPWVRRANELMEPLTAEIPRAASGAWRAAFATGAATEAFTPLEKAEFGFVQTADPATVLDRFLSVSAIATRGQEERAGFAARLAAILADDPSTRGAATVEIPYRTEVFTCVRRGGPL